MSRFVLALEAAEDIEEIVNHIAQQNVSAAFDVEDLFVESFRRLAQFPDSGHRRLDLAGKRRLLFWSVGSYLILYRKLHGGIEVVAVLHGARDIASLLRHRKGGR